MDISLLHRVVQHLLTVLLVLLISCPQSVEADPHSLETLAKQGDQIELNPSSAGRKRKWVESKITLIKQIPITSVLAWRDCNDSAAAIWVPGSSRK